MTSGWKGFRNHSMMSFVLTLTWRNPMLSSLGRRPPRITGYLASKLVTNSQGIPLSWKFGNERQKLVTRNISGYDGFKVSHWDLSLCSSQKISKEIRNTWINSMTVHYIMNLQMWNKSRLQVSYEYSPRFDPFASCIQIVCLVEIAMSILAVKTAFAIIWF